MLILLFAAVAPAIILLWYVYHKDTEPEPPRLIFKGFFYGGLSALLSTLISGPLLNMGFYTTDPSTWGEAVKIAFCSKDRSNHNQYDPYGYSFFIENHIWNTPMYTC